MLLDTELDEVRIIVDSVEQAIYVEAPDGRHSDGSLRSVLVQFNISITYGSPLYGTAYIGGGVSRGTGDISKTSITTGTPQVACLPTDTQYLIDTLLIPPTVSVADSPSSPSYFPAYEADWDLWSERHWDQAYPLVQSSPSDGDPWWSGYSQYDRTLVWFIWFCRTADEEYFYRFCQSGTEYTNVVAAKASNNMFAPRFHNPEGMAIQYWMTGWESARDECVRQSNYCRVYYSGYLDAPGGDSRIGSKIMRSANLCHLLEDTSQSWDTVAEDALTRILATQSASGAFDKFSVYNYEHSCYQTGMVYYSFWFYYTWHDADSRILPAVKKALDYEIANEWVEDDLSFKYLSSSSGGSPDLNGLSLFGYSWYYSYSSTETYKTYADKMVDGLQLYAYLFGYKQFNQAFRQSTPHLLWRST
jgi:hypothetical protein